MCFRLHHGAPGAHSLGAPPDVFLRLVNIPVAPMCDAAGVDEALAFRDQSKSFEDAGSPNLSLFLSARESPGALHSMLNAVQQAREALPESQVYEPMLHTMLKSVCKNLLGRRVAKSSGSSPMR